METPLQGQDGANVQLVECMGCSCTAQQLWKRRCRSSASSSSKVELQARQHHEMLQPLGQASERDLGLPHKPGRLLTLLHGQAGRGRNVEQD